jgi:hypothetical protein
VSLSGSAFVPAPVVSLVPSSLSFPAQLVGTSSAPMTVVLSNTGTADLVIDSIATTGPFSQTNACTSPLAPGTNCTIMVTFTPTAVGNASGALVVSDNASGSPQMAPLSGTGFVPAPVVSLTPGALTFPLQLVGTRSAPQAVTLRNTGSAPLLISSITTTGPFGLTSLCGTTLAAGAQCTVLVTFDPSAPGNATGTLVVVDNASPGSQTVALSGTATLTPVVPAVLRPRMFLPGCFRDNRLRF